MYYAKTNWQFKERLGILSAKLGRNKITDNGFTRLDLLVTIASVILLIFVAIVLYEQHHISSAELRCRFNIQHIDRAILAYALDNAVFPAAGRRDKPVTNDWIHWQNGRKLEESAVKVLDPKEGVKTLLCPLDTKSRYRTYPYSYTMNLNLEKKPYNKIIQQPNLILIYEEEHPNDGACAPDAPDDIPALRHRHKTLVGRVDGTVELIRRSEAIKEDRYKPKLK